VASSHHLEHIPRWEQEVVWREVFRVCKPGGRIEHTVPSLEWAAAKIADGQADEHVFNVLYGAQESHGYERTLNLHYFGYTKSIARALAEAVGFESVVCEDWQDRPELGYNLIIRGEKPDEELPVATEEETGEVACLEGDDR
jgi:predicted SAM-dependent methyltransferase